MSGRGLVPGPGGEITRRSRGLAARGLDLAERLGDDRSQPAALPHESAFRAAALSADGRWLAAARSGSSRARGVLLVALDGSEAVAEGLTDAWVRSVRFLGAGTEIVAATQDGEVVQLRLDGERLGEVARRRCPSGAADPPRAVSAAPDGGFVAVLLSTATVVGLPWPDGPSWTFDLGEERTNGSNPRLACAFEPAPVGKLAVVGDRVLMFDRTGSGGRLASLPTDFAAGPTALCWSGSELLAVEGSELVRFPLLGGRPETRTLVAGDGGGIGRAAISPSGTIVALDLTTRAAIEVYDPSGRLLARRPAGARGVEALAVGDDGLLAVAQGDGWLTVWAPHRVDEPLLRMRDRAPTPGSAIASG